MVWARWLERSVVRLCGVTHMQEYDLFVLLRATLAQQLPSRNSGKTIGLALAYQPTQQGGPASTATALRMNTASVRRVGWRRSASKWDNVAGAAVLHELQAMQHVIQITTIPPLGVPENPQTENDIANMVASCMQSDKYISALRSNGVQVLRVTDIRMGRFRDENNQWSNWPNFDISLTHNDEFLGGVPVVSKWEGLLTRIPDLV